MVETRRPGRREGVALNSHPAHSCVARDLLLGRRTTGGVRGRGARTREIAVLFDHAGSVGLRHLRSRRARKRADRWLANFVGHIRNGRFHPPEDSAAHIIAWHRDLNGELLTPHVAAIELLNVIRPTVAVSVYMIFVAYASQSQREASSRR